MRKRFFIAAALLAGVAAPASAGPPYLTDDPDPTEKGHWEIYAFSAAAGSGSTVDADAGFDLNYGPVKDVQLTATLPLSFSHDSAGWSSRTGDVELGLKYRFFNDEKRGISAAIFPRAILPTSTGVSDGRVRILLPLWAGKDFAGGTSIFGGGGYEINPGPGNRNFWQGGIVVNHEIAPGFSAGAELFRQGADTVGGKPQTALGLGTIIHIRGPSSLLLSGGPSWSGNSRGYHLYAALGLNF